MSILTETYFFLKYGGIRGLLPIIDKTTYSFSYLCDLNFSDVAYQLFLETG